MNGNIRNLKPAAARLLLAILASQGQGSFDEVVVHSGISECSTLTQAKEQLRDLGFIIDDEQGERATLDVME